MPCLVDPALTSTQGEFTTHGTLAERQGHGAPFPLKDRRLFLQPRGSPERDLGFEDLSQALSPHLVSGPI